MQFCQEDPTIQLQDVEILDLALVQFYLNTSLRCRMQSRTRYHKPSSKFCNQIFDLF